MFWKRKTTTNYTCSNCGKPHEALPAIGFNTPFHYEDLTEFEKEKMAEIDDDFCVIYHLEQTDRFIRTILKIKLSDSCEELHYGVWVSLSEKSFNEYRSGFKNNIEGKVYFGTICNIINDYPESTLGLHVNVETKGNGFRPEIIPHKNRHQLVIDCEKGISFEEAKNRVEKTVNGIIPFIVRIYRNKKFFFPLFVKIKINRNDAMLDFSFLDKEKNLYFLYSKFQL